MIDTTEILDTLAQAICDKKGFNIIALDVRGISSLTDYFLIAEGNVQRHVAAIADTLIDAARKKGVRPLHVEGLKDGDWCVVDFGFIVVHLFVPDLRERYALEQVWKESKLAKLNIVTERELPL